MKKTLACGIVILFATSAFAQADIGFKAIGARLGYVMPEADIENTIGFGAQVDLGSITTAIKLGAYVDYWSKGYDETYWEWSWSVIGIGATAKYLFDMEGNIKPYAGAGLGLNIGKWSSDYKGPTYEYVEYIDSSGSDTDLGIHILGGAQMELSPTLVGIGEVKYVIDGADYFGIWVGVLYLLGQ